nr:hypothetical protein [Tanacetum cinerariifolium]
MAEQQTIMYAPQWNNMTVDDVIFQTNNVVGALFKKSKRPKSEQAPTKTKVTPPKPTEGYEQSHSVSSSTVPDLQDLERDIQLVSMGLPSTLDEGTRKSKPLPKVTSAKYQENQTQFSRLRYQSLTENKGEPSYEGEPDTQPIILSYADVRAIFLSEDKAQESEEDILGAGVEMDDTPQSNETQHYDIILKKYDDTLPFTERQLVKYLRKNIQDHAFKQEEASAAWMKYSTNMAWNLVSIISGLERAQNYIKSSIVTLTFVITDTPANVKGENATYTATKEPPSHTEEETNTNIQERPEEPKQSTDVNVREGKGIATDDQVEDQRKLVKASSIVRLDPDEPDKEEKIKKAEEAAKLNALSKTKSPENARFSMKLRKLIAEHPDQEKLKSKKVKLKALG